MIYVSLCATVIGNMYNSQQHLLLNKGKQGTMEQAFFLSLQGHVSLQPTTEQVNLGYQYRTLNVILIDLRTIRCRGILCSIFQAKKCSYGLKNTVTL
jgi:hypothetical protein